MQVLSDLPSGVATQIVQATGATLDVCFDMLPTRFHPLALVAICPSVSSDATLCIDGSRNQWTQRSSPDRHCIPVPAIPGAVSHTKNQPKGSSRILLCLFNAAATLTTLSALHLSLSFGRDNSPATTEVSQAFSTALLQLSGLTSLEVRKSVAELAVPALSSALLNMPHLQRLVVDNGQLSSENMCMLIKQLKHVPELTALHLSDEHLVLRSPKAAASLSASLCLLKSLQDLNVTGFQSLGQTKKSLQALSELVSLTRLNIESTGLVPETVPVLTEALHSMQKLQHLSLRYNQLGKIHVNSIARASEVPECIKPLCTVLLSLKELCTVDFSCTHLGCDFECTAVHEPCACVQGALLA